MTEKRFFQDGNEILTWIRDKETWEKLKTDTDVINKLNELVEENQQYKEYIQRVDKINNELRATNNELQLIKEFAENNGISISSIEDAFRRCWNDNGKLVKENQKLLNEISMMNDMLNEYYTADTSEKMNIKLKRLLKELGYFRKANDTVNWQAYKEKEFEGL